MRKVVPTVFVLAAISLGDAATAQTLYDYPWCAAYSRSVKSCGFVTFEQCLATIRGVGGFCEPNPFYRPPVAKKRRAQR